MTKKIMVALVMALMLAGVGKGGVMVYQKVRGLRNNNPLNIRRSADRWEGLSPEQTDSSFFQFIEPVYGIRAAARILSNYAKRGINTLEKIISTWAPAVENDTEGYIKYVSSKTGFDRKKVITKSSGDYVPLLAAMIQMENGINPYSDALIAQGVSMS